MASSSQTLELDSPEKVGQIWVNGACKDIYYDRSSTTAYLLAAGLEGYTGIVLDREEYWLGVSQEFSHLVVIDELVMDGIERILSIHNTAEKSAQTT